MQVSRGNILKTTGMLCNPNFIDKRIIGILMWAPYISSPLASLPKMVKQEVPASTKQNWIFVLWPSVGPPLSFVINKRGMLAKLDIDRQMGRERQEIRAVCSKASLTLETTGDQRTANTRHRYVVLLTYYTKLLYSCVMI